MKKFTLEQLDKMSTKRLLNVLRSSRYSAIYMQYEDWKYTETDQKESEEFYQLVKMILSEREHVKRKTPINPTGKTRLQRKMRYILKRVTKKLKLPKEHPLVIEEFKNAVEEWKKYNGHSTINYRNFLHVK